MTELFNKELKLAASPLSYFFIIAAFLTFVPGYPILLGAFFTTLGIFYSFQTMRENGDIQYSLLLPIAKRDIVRAKYLFVVFIEACSFILMTVITLVRMLFLADTAAYASNALMCANLSFLGFALLIFGLYNFIFVRGFFKTAYYFGKPFIAYIVVSLIVIIFAEALHHFPGMESVNSFGFDEILPQCVILCVGAVSFAVLTLAAVKKSVKTFERIDL